MTRQLESQIIMDALEQNRWNRRRAAESLRISYRSLMYKMKHCNLRDQPAGIVGKTEWK
jgi:DNA-binding NtrC family response regulator